MPTKAVNKTDLRKRDLVKAGPDDILKPLTRVTKAAHLLHWVDHWNDVQVESADYFGDRFSEGADRRGVPLRLGDTLGVKEEDQEVHLVAGQANARVLVPLTLVLCVGGVKPKDSLAEAASGLVLVNLSNFLLSRGVLSRGCWEVNEGPVFVVRRVPMPPNA